MNFPYGDHPRVNAFRQQVWHHGVRMPHQGARECARRLRQRGAA